MDEKERIYKAYYDSVLNEKEEKVEEASYFMTKKVPQAKIKKVMEKAHDAFWAVVAKSFPEAKGGDMDPMQTVKMENDMMDVINVWLENNVY